MTIYKLPEKCLVDSLPAGCAVALGNFDGVHIGHKQLFRLAGKNGHKTAAWTFTSLAKPGATVPFLTDMQTRLELFCSCGLDYAIFEEFENIRNMDCREFVCGYLVSSFSPARVVCGFNFRFGRGGAGDADTFRSLLNECNIDCEVMSAVYHNGVTVSSSYIREAILKGDMEGACQMLGHPFTMRFPVVEGKRLGRQMGKPTINQDFPAGHIIPRHGVYAARATVDDVIYAAVANVGTRPTVSEDISHVNCETHILDFSGDLYGKEIKIEFCKFLRDEAKFDSVDALFAQINADAERAAEIFASHCGK